MITAFICANLYGLLHVCQIRTTQYSNKRVEYDVLLTDNRWYKVNRCTAQKAVVGRRFREVKESRWCLG